jgi:ABC-type uncharacterized transport system, permease component
MFRIVKRSGLTRKQVIVYRTVAILSALVAAGIFILALGHNPFAVYASMLNGAFGSLYRFKETIIKAIPLVITSLGICIAFKMKFWNIGAEGQIFMGAFAASYFGLNYPGIPMPLMLLIMAIAGFIVGGIWALIPALFKAQYGTNETLFTLMMNYIALKWVTYLQYGPWKNPEVKGFPLIAKFHQNAWMPKVFGIHAGLIVMLLLVVVIYIFMNYTKKGYEIAVVGESENTARYAGMNIKKIIIFSILLSGGLCGLSGMIQVSGVNHTLGIEVTSGVGYTAIITTWLGQLSAPIILLVSFLFSALVQGGSFIQTAFQIPQAVAQLIQGMILFFVLGSEFFIQYKLAFKEIQIFKNRKEVV